MLNQDARAERKSAVLEAAIEAAWSQREAFYDDDKPVYLAGWEDACEHFRRGMHQAFEATHKAIREGVFD